MARKQMMFKTKGMNKDLSVSAFNPEFAFDNRNLRLSTNDSNTLMSWVNERGPAEIEIYKEGTETVMSIEGITVGTAVLNHYLVLFTTTNTEKDSKGTDRIYRLKYRTGKTIMDCTNLYEGSGDKSLNLCTANPLETLVSYETEDVQKVYWTDNRNQPRSINIASDERYNETSFDFVPTLKLEEEVTVSRVSSSFGSFPAGVIQYAFTYYNKNGHESNIFYTSPLRFIAPIGRGGAPDERVGCAFNIKVTHLDNNFLYMRIYSILRTSIDATPFCKRVADISLSNIKYTENDAFCITYTDTGTSGDSIDPTELLYKGGEEIVAGTFEQKDGTIFFGDIQVTRPLLHEELGGFYGSATHKITGITLKLEYNRITNTQVGSSETTYRYFNLLNMTNGSGECGVPCNGFRRGNVYRLGVLFQYKNGKWSDPFYVGDFGMDTNHSTDTVDSISLPRWGGIISHRLTLILKNLGYRKARALVVYPDVLDRGVISQGVLCPTLYTDNHRKELRDLLAQSSWFYRPFIPKVEGESIENKNDLANKALRYIYKNSTVSPAADIATDNDQNKNEIPSIAYPSTGDITEMVLNYPPLLRRHEILGYFEKENRFKIDWDILTMNTPDAEFDESFCYTDYTDSTLMYIGDASFTNTMSDINIQTETPTIGGSSDGFVKKTFLHKNSYGIVAGLFYSDRMVDDASNKSTGGDGKSLGILDAFKTLYSDSKWLVYPWHRSGSLNNDINRPAGIGVLSAKLKKKIISNLRYTVSNWFESLSNNNKVNISYKPVLFNSDEVEIVKVEHNKTWSYLENGVSNETIEYPHNYYGNVDTILNPDKSSSLFFCFNNEHITTEEEVDTPFTSGRWWKLSGSEKGTVEEDGSTKTLYYRLYRWVSNEREGEHGTFGSANSFNNNSVGWTKDNIGTDSKNIGDYAPSISFTKDLVRMKYKSAPHLVFMNPGFIFEAKKDIYYLPIVNIQRKLNELSGGNSTLFGGENIDALKANKWIPCGKPVKLGNKIDDYGNAVTKFNYNYGDTYYLRYDCLKTYPFTPEDENQIVEIGSFMLESYTNIDGRYDRNRGQLSNLYMTPRNFNLFNPVYTQKDNFFTYRILDDSDYKTMRYPNQITWSKTKQSGADIDLWTNVTLASSMELDGNKGKINKLIRLNDLLLCFQDSGISQIMYNENVQISSTEGVPIEIANSGKVQGVRYLSDTVGCSNKWSIAVSPAGIYFMDSNDKSIYLFNGQLNNLSLAGGFNSWCKMNIPSATLEWTPDNCCTFASHYDKINQDILFIDNHRALAFNEKLEAFTSFYDYNNIPWFVNLDDTGVWLKTDNNNTDIWKHLAGKYCDFFGERKSYWMILVGNPEPLLDKTFTNLEFRACVEEDKDIPFDKLETWNEYQAGIAYLGIRNGHTAMVHHTKDNNASLKRKFRIWRCDIPRDNADGIDAFEDTFDIEFHRDKVKRPLDRMRNPWIYLKLTKNALEDEVINGLTVSREFNKTEIHDIVMTYFG